MAIGAPILYHNIVARVKDFAIVFCYGCDRFLQLLAAGFWCYNKLMKTLNHLLANEAERVWGALCELRPGLVRYDVPEFELSRRLWRTAGMCYQEDRIIVLGAKFFEHSREYCATMTQVILPHELIHQADFDLYGESEKNCGHGAQWQRLMIEYGLPAKPFHSMDIAR